VPILDDHVSQVLLYRIWIQQCEQEFVSSEVYDYLKYIFPMYLCHTSMIRSPSKAGRGYDSHLGHSGIIGGAVSQDMTTPLYSTTPGSTLETRYRSECNVIYSTSFYCDLTFNQFNYQIEDHAKLA
jgi:hypothetical protein